MLKENPYLHSWDGDALIRALANVLHRPDVLLIVLIACAGIAFGALLKVWADLRRDRARQSGKPTPSRSTNPFTGGGSSDEWSPAGGTNSAGNLGYSTIGRSKCQWQKDAVQPFADSTRWICASCRGFSFSSDGDPPATCRAYEPRQKI